MPTQPKAMAPSQADSLAIKAFSHISMSEVSVAQFLQATGIEQDTIRKAARSPAFLRGVLDYVLADEDLLLEVAEALDTTPETLLTASKRLSRPAPKAPELAPREARPAKAPRGGEKGDLYAGLPRRSMFRQREPGESVWPSGRVAEPDAHCNLGNLKLGR